MNAANMNAANMNAANMNAANMNALNPKASSKVAVILNANAKRVTPRVLSELEREAQGADIYYSRSLEEAQSIHRQVQALEYSAVLTGGGDGTIIQSINTLYKLTGRLEQSPPVQRAGGRLQALPKPPKELAPMGILKLGTGNALASVVGAGRHHQDLARVRDILEGGAELSTLELPLIEANGEVFPFAGFGLDAMILNDYNQLKNSAKNPLSKALFESVAGYLVAAFARSAPRLAMNRSAEVEVRTLDRATLLDAEGGPAKEFKPGEILYRGPVNMLSMATIPFYGYDFRMFPFADNLTDTFQLRVAKLGVPEALAHLPAIWRGTYRSPRLMDFHCRRLTMTFNRNVPFQVGGDARGERDTLTVGMSNHPVKLVDYKTALQSAETVSSSRLPQLALGFGFEARRA